MPCHNLLGQFRDNFKISSRNFLINLILFTSFFTFYFVFSLRVIPHIFDSNVYSQIQALFSFTIIIALIMISHLIRNKTSEKQRITISGIAISASILFLFLVPSLVAKLVCVFAIGISFAVGQLSAYTYFWRSSEAKERGRIGGLISFIGLPIYFVASNFIAASVDLFGKTLLCLLLSGLAVTSLYFKKPSIKERVTKSEYYPEKRTILLYSIPWIIFTFVNATFAKNISEITSTTIAPSLYAQLTIIQTFEALIGALTGGFLADFVGRRLTLVLSVTLYGVSMTLRGFINNDLLYFFGFAAEGLSWGIFLTLFSFVIWGDLSNRENNSKIYGVGLSTFYLFAGLGLSSFFHFDSLITNTLISCLLIFLSNIPIILAPELMPSDAREKIKLENYVKNIKRVVKEAEKKS